MKRMILGCLLLFMMPGTGMAQNWQEWFQQKATQKKYLIQQIAALKVYGASLVKGYRIVQHGLKGIGQITNQEFALHTRHFRSLQYVSPFVQGDPNVAAIYHMDSVIRKAIQRILASVAHGSDLTGEETAYVGTILDKLRTSCTQILKELESVLKDRQLEMSDAQRASIISRSRIEMQNRLQWVLTFSHQVKFLAKSREREKKELEYSKQINGIE